MKRVLTATILVPSISYLVLWAPEMVFTVVMSIIGVFAFLEYATMAEAHGFTVNRWAGAALGVVLLLLKDERHALWWIFLIGFGSMVAAMRVADLRQALPSASALLLGICYVFGSWWCGAKLREVDHWLLFFGLALNWVGDSAAMFAGRKFGRHKLSPIVSPGKTWEGSIASVVASVLLGFALFQNFGPRMPWWFILVLAVVGNAAGQVGDLAESAIKRGAGMKDSGTSLPGHGGWLDRIDSSLFAIPAVYFVYQAWLAVWAN
jgi:phosphatidate cytidylyltransferase